MAEKIVLNNVAVIIDHVTLTTRARQVTIDTSADELPADAFGGNGWKEFEAGLHEGQITIELYQGFDSGGTNQTLWPLHRDSLEFDFTIGPNGSTASSTNPLFTGTGKLYQYQWLNGEVGQLSMNTITIRLTGPPTVTET